MIRFCTHHCKDLKIWALCYDPNVFFWAAQSILVQSLLPDKDLDITCQYLRKTTDNILYKEISAFSTCSKITDRQNKNAENAEIWFFFLLMELFHLVVSYRYFDSINIISLDPETWHLFRRLWRSPCFRSDPQFNKTWQHLKDLRSPLKTIWNYAYRSQGGVAPKLEAVRFRGERSPKLKSWSMGIPKQFLLQHYLVSITAKRSKAFQRL